MPVIGCDCPVCTSRDPRDRRLRTAALLSYAGKNFAIDAGPDFRAQMLRARVGELDGVLLTHEHYDHTAGLDDLRPFCFRQKIDMPVYCLPRVARELKKRIAYAFTDYPGVPRLDLREVNFGDRIPFAGTEIELLEVLHGKLPIFGLRWQNMAYLTDVKTLPARTQVRCQNCKAVVISALHPAGTHSHLSLQESLDYLAELAPDRGILTHFSHRMGRARDVGPTLPLGVEMGWDGMVL